MPFYVKKKRQPVIIIVALIDILTVLLIFFVATTTFRKNEPNQVNISLPESAAPVPRSSPDAPKPALLEVTADESLLLDGQPLDSADALAPALRALLERSPGRTIALRADKKASYGLIVSLLDSLRSAGVTNIPALTQEKPAP